MKYFRIGFRLGISPLRNYMISNIYQGFDYQMEIALCGAVNKRINAKGFS